jgi:DNA replication protein DnaC
MTQQQSIGKQKQQNTCNKAGTCLNGRYTDECKDYNMLPAKEYTEYMEAIKNGTALDGYKTCPRWELPAYSLNSCPKKSNNWQYKLRQADIPARYEFANRGVTQDSKSWLALNQYMDTLEENMDSGQGLLMFGSFGTGKTTAAVVVAQEAISKGYSVKFLGVDYLTAELRGMQYEQAAIFRNELAEKDLIILDGLEADADGKWLLEEVGAIIARRYDNRKSIIVTTNSTPEQLKSSSLPQRYIVRILHACKVIPIVGKNWREGV